MKNIWKKIIVFLLAFSMVMSSFSVSGISVKAETTTTLQDISLYVGSTLELTDDSGNYSQENENNTFENEYVSVKWDGESSTELTLLTSVD